MLILVLLCCIWISESLILFWFLLICVRLFRCICWRIGLILFWLWWVVYFWCRLWYWILSCGWFCCLMICLILCVWWWVWFLVVGLVILLNWLIRRSVLSCWLVWSSWLYLCRLVYGWWVMVWFWLILLLLFSCCCFVFFFLWVWFWLVRVCLGWVIILNCSFCFSGVIKLNLNWWSGFWKRCEV